MKVTKKTAKGCIVCKKEEITNSTCEYTVLLQSLYQQGKETLHETKINNMIDKSDFSMMLNTDNGMLMPNVMYARKVR